MSPPSPSGPVIVSTRSRKISSAFDDLLASDFGSDPPRKRSAGRPSGASAALYEPDSAALGALGGDDDDGDDGDDDVEVVPASAVPPAPVPGPAAPPAPPAPPAAVVPPPVAPLAGPVGDPGPAVSNRPNLTLDKTAQVLDRE